MYAPSTTDTSNELNTITDIRARYELPGPHATAILRIPKPGVVGDDLETRWHSIENELLSVGASRRSVELLRDRLRSQDRCGRTVLITANDDSAAHCWLGDDFEPSIGVGAVPALVPALHQVASEPASTIAAAIDRTGADLYRVDHFDIEAVSSVVGEVEHVHKAASGGWSQARHQRHSEVVWERNAMLIATSIVDEVAMQSADGVLLTGDDREVRLVEAQLARCPVGAVVRRAAGGRHEPGTPDRLRAATLDFRSECRGSLTDRALGDLREELGQHDRAVAGSVQVLEAIAENRVGTLFVDLDTDRGAHHVDATVRSALALGADIVTGRDFDLDDGVAAILRVPYP